MRKFLLVIGALALAACQPGLTPPSTPTTAPSASVVTATALCPSGSYGARTLVDEKRLYDAEALYNVPAHAYVVADGNEQLPASLKATVKPLLQSAFKALKLARAAYCAGNSEGLLNQFNAVAHFANQAKALLPKTN